MSAHSEAANGFVISDKALLMRPVCFDTCGHVYRLMGEAVAKAFSCGKELM